MVKIEDEFIITRKTIKNLVSQLALSANTDNEQNWQNADMIDFDKIIEYKNGSTSTQKKTNIEDFKKQVESENLINETRGAIINYSGWRCYSVIPALNEKAKAYKIWDVNQKVHVFGTLTDLKKYINSHEETFLCNIYDNSNDKFIGRVVTDPRKFRVYKNKPKAKPKKYAFIDEEIELYLISDVTKK